VKLPLEMTGGTVALGGVRRKPGDPVLRARDERLEALKSVAGKLAHDFNNFLVPQFGYVTLLKEELPGESSSAQYLEAMETAGKRTETYIESILMGMRPHRHFSPAEFSLDGVVTEALARWSEPGPGMMLEVGREIEACTIFGDEKHWKSAVTQLLANARYALATGGRLEVELKRESLSGEEIVRLGLGTDDIFRLVVRDDGFGMSRDVAERAFEPFFTTRTQVKAAGLGLTIVHSVAQVHGGQVELVTGEDEGTTVTVWIPASGFVRRSASSSGSSRDGAKKKVLLVEDDVLMKEVLRDWLGRINLEVQIASTVEEAESVFERKSGELALVITETDLKVGKGEEIYARLREVNPTVPWIFLAGRRRPQLDGAPDNGSSGPLVMQKPVTLRALAEVVRKHAAL
jgi:CheY-like chemotaxis protein/anti-sigma regulatory factor (Ser/Thr protein kinase)